MSEILTVAQPRPLVDLATEALREDLLSAVHAPGDKLKVDALRARYGYSSSPLREALNRLTQEGLVLADQRRGFRVAPMSVEDFADTTRMRLMLDLQALRESIQDGDDEWEVRSVSAFHRLQKVESRLTDQPLILDSEWSARHKDFHMCLLSGTSSQRLRSMSSTLFDQAERYRRVSAAFRDEPRSKSDEHHAILDAAIGRDVDVAVALLTTHISRTRANVERALGHRATAGAVL